MQDFWIYLELGWQHILDLGGYDHILFVLVLCCNYPFKDWRRVLILITAFTVGHSITLALATFKLVNVDMTWVEFLIPVTILITGVSNLRNKEAKKQSSIFLYLMALVFGLIHGLGFSNYLQSLLGQEANIFWPLLAFNVGLELGQILIVFVVFFITEILIRFFTTKQRDWVFFLSSAIIGISFVMSLERLPL